MTTKRLYTALAVAATALAFGAKAEAGPWTTSNGTLQVSSLIPAAGAPLTDIRQISGTLGDGFVYTNQIDGTAFTSGEVRTISVQRIVTALNDPTNYLGTQIPIAQNFLAVTALRGALVGGGTADFSELRVPGAGGRLYLYSLPLAPPYAPSDPSNWGPLPAVASRLAQYTLATHDVLNGQLHGIPNSTPVIEATTTAALMNLGGISVLGGLPVGQFLFLTDNEPSQNTPTNGINFLRDVPLPVPPGGSTNKEGLYVTINQLLADTRGLNGMDGIDLGILNGIYMDAFGIDWATAFGTEAATGISSDFYAKGGQFADFVDNPASGDFFAQFSSDANPVSAIPEPGSIVLLSLGVAAIFATRFRRRKS